MPFANLNGLGGPLNQLQNKNPFSQPIFKTKDKPFLICTNLGVGVLNSYTMRAQQSADMPSLLAAKVPSSNSNNEFKVDCKCFLYILAAKLGLLRPFNTSLIRGQLLIKRGGMQWST